MQSAIDKYKRLIKQLNGMGSMILAYSGGVDSTFLLKALTESKARFLAVTGASPTMPESDYDTAKEIAEELGAPHKVVQSGEMNNPDFVANPVDRCYYCKDTLFQKLLKVAEEEGYDTVVDGSIADDAGDYRPGLKAKEQNKIASPMMDVGLTKEEVRYLSKEKKLRTWDKPASPCLSSRIPYGSPIDLPSLRMIEQSEILLRQEGFKEVRVRKQGDSARIEIPQSEIPLLLNEGLREKVVTAMKDIGFLYISLDLEGFQSGKLNRPVFAIKAS